MALIDSDLAIAADCGIYSGCFNREGTIVTKAEYDAAISDYGMCSNGGLEISNNYISTSANTGIENPPTCEEIYTLAETLTPVDDYYIILYSQPAGIVIGARTK